MERIPVTHAGSLIRPPELPSFLAAKDHGEPYDRAAYASALAVAVTDVVREQVETGVDIVDDGEMGKSNWITYLYERVSGLESRRELWGVKRSVMNISKRITTQEELSCEDVEVLDSRVPPP